MLALDGLLEGGYIDELAPQPSSMQITSSSEAPAATEPASRNLALDGVRGISALSVALGHCYLIATGLDIWGSKLSDFPAMLPGDVGYRLLSLAFPADAAVMVFFVLSGRVLWQSFVRRGLGCADLPDYVLARIWRIMPLIIPATSLMEWFARVPASELLANALLLRTDVLGVTWSLQVELVGSVALAAMWLWSLNAVPKMIGCLAVAVILVPLMRGTLFVYLPAFALGGLIGACPDSVWRKRPLFWAGLAVLMLANIIFSHGGVTRCFEMVGATIVVGCIGTRPLGLLQTPPVLFLGAISYPLYLCHPFGAGVATITLAGFQPTRGLAAFILMAAVSLLVAVPLAWLLHVGIELPCMRWRPKY